MKLSVALVAIITATAASVVSGKVTQVKPKNLKKAIDVKGKVVVEFRANNEHVRFLDKGFRNMSDTYPDIAFLAIDILTASIGNTAEEYSINIEHVPTFVTFKDGQEVGKRTRVLKMEQLEERLKDFAAS